MNGKKTKLKATHDNKINQTIDFKKETLCKKISSKNDWTNHAVNSNQ